MSKIDQMIHQLCPDGVEYRRLGEVCEMKRGTAITKKDVVEGDIPVVAGGQKPAYYCDKANRTGETITVAGSGAYAGYVAYWNTPIFVSDAFSVKGNDNITTKYVYHVLKNMQDSIYSTKKGGGVPHVHISSIESFTIPLPPLAIQEEIVRILDKFTELEARRAQYEYYRDTLLTFAPDDPAVTWTTLGEVCEIPKQRVKMADVSCYVGVENLIKERGGVSKDFDRDASENAIGFLPDDVLIGNIRPYLKKVWQADCAGGTNGDVIVLRKAQEDIDARYLYFVLSSDKFLDFLNGTAKGGKMPRGDKKRVPTYPIPLPPLATQRHIASILDKFEALTTDLTSGLPAEIQARRQQYEYYRDKLLTFKRKEA